MSGCYLEREERILELESQMRQKLEKSINDQVLLGRELFEIVQTLSGKIKKIESALSELVVSTVCEQCHGLGKVAVEDDLHGEADSWHVDECLVCEGNGVYYKRSK